MDLGMLRCRGDARAQVVEDLAEEIGGVLQDRAVLYKRIVQIALLTALACQGEPCGVVIGCGVGRSRRCGRCGRFSTCRRGIAVWGPLLGIFRQSSRTWLEAAKAG